MFIILFCGHYYNVHFIDFLKELSSKQFILDSANLSCQYVEMLDKVQLKHGTSKHNIFQAAIKLLPT
jgi:hypothetical protein